MFEQISAEIRCGRTVDLTETIDSAWMKAASVVPLFGEMVYLYADSKFHQSEVMIGDNLRIAVMLGVSGLKKDLAAGSPPKLPSEYQEALPRAKIARQYRLLATARCVLTSVGFVALTVLGLLSPLPPIIGILGAVGFLLLAFSHAKEARNLKHGIVIAEGLNIFNTLTTSARIDLFQKFHSL